MNETDRGEQSGIELTPQGRDGLAEGRPTSLRELLEMTVRKGEDRGFASRSPAAGPSQTKAIAREPRGGAATSPTSSDARVHVRGKFFYVGDEKLYLSGVTYGPFRPGPDGCEYNDPSTVARDFEAMADNGINTVRTYTVPPRWLLDVAHERGLRVMVGIAWEQHVTFLEDRATERRIVETVRAGVRDCAGHPAVLAFAVGNEIPAPIVRWHGARRIERFINRLYRAAKREDAAALVTYVNYPTTEYLELGFLDFLCFNVYLEARDRLEVYLARLHNLAGEHPLVMAEIGLDSMRNGEDVQAETVAWQIDATYESGCAGAVVFSWTDAWYRGGHDILDWAFGLTDRDRRPKPALAAVRASYLEILRTADGDAAPLISVVVCTYNGAPTIRECLDAVTRLEYPKYEVIVVNDGSVDDTASIVSEFDVRHLPIENGGLSNARNVGMRAATGTIIAYVDDDAFPDPHWLNYLALAFGRSDHVGIGGPNLPPLGRSDVADCVANSPGGPSHVLHTDVEAEHLPGANMAFRKEAIEAIDGFDVRFDIAGDDVDLCWRLLKRGGTLGFNAGALVWHHRRGSVRGYLRQQRNYGKAEAMLEKKWPQKYNRLGHLRWAGYLYGRGHTRPLPFRGKRVLHGVWGTRLFQSVYGGPPGSLTSLTLMPEWYLVAGALAIVSLTGLLWSPLLAVLPVLIVAVVVPLAQAFMSAWGARFAGAPTGARRAKLIALTALLNVLQPFARLVGRLGGNLTPWRPHGVGGLAVPRRFVLSHWSETWRFPIDWLESLERSLQVRRVLVRRGGACDRWDLQTGCGMLGGARLIATTEEHGAGRQLIRVRVWPRLTGFARLVLPSFVAMTATAGIVHAWTPSLALAILSLVLLSKTLLECMSALNSVRGAVRDWGKDDDSD